MPKEEQEYAESCRVGVRVPPFYPEKPALWFAQLEGQFVLSNISSDTTRFYYTIAQLEPQYAAEVEDIITSPPTSGKYDKLKAELIKRLSASREKKVKQLLTHEELGDRKPSQFLRHLQNLAGPGVPEDFLKTIWSSRLPQGTQTIIASQLKASLEELADLADRIHDVVPSYQHVASTSHTPPDSLVATMERQIAALTEQVRTLSTEVRRSRATRQGRDKNRSSSRHRRRSHSTRSASNYRNHPLCWYHTKFGGKAKCCVKPCDYSGNDAGGR
ncbi:unnamed protein product [Arctia plantaginis]|uniref:DUF7041 domain-containing protein n=1 Tax=Arctia plantaginis TaxID=874455 RepID=A0A8S1A0Z1_ARCPL|nr:unnamed protein product [Arctia plantaginis]